MNSHYARLVELIDIIRTNWTVQRVYDYLTRRGFCVYDFETNQELIEAVALDLLEDDI